MSVRAGRSGDEAAIADLLMEALGVKYRPALGPRSREALERVVGHELDAGTGGYVVAEDADAILGAAHLAVAEDPPPAGLTRTVADIVGRPRAVWATLTLSLLAHGPPAPDEAYIGELGVRGDARRRGIATLILRHLETAAADLGKRRLTLWVTTENDAARALYAATGFREVRTRRWLVGGMVFGSRGAVLMEKRVEA